MAKIERLNKAELIDYCKNIGLETQGKKKSILLEEVEKYRTNEIQKAIKTGNGYDLLVEKISILAEEYAVNLKFQNPTKLFLAFFKENHTL